jgi:uncharacterized protein (TIGR00730 family)
MGEQQAMNANTDKSSSEPTTVSLADEEGVRRILTDTLFGLWGAVNNLTRLRPSKREHYRVTIFGSARTQSDSWVYQAVKRMSAALSAMGCDIVTGGGPGLMQAANEGARESSAAERVHNVGIRVTLPFEQTPNPYVDELFEHQTFFTRLHHFVLTSDAFIVAPGGIGTVLESMMIWQLLQVRHLHDTPLIFAGPMWEGLVTWVKQAMLRPGFELASAQDIQIPQCVSGAEEAIALVRKHHARWQDAQKQAT